MDKIDVQNVKEKTIQTLRESYELKLEEEMGLLHNQFVSFIATSRLPIPQVLLVLQMLVKETTDQASIRYLGEK